MSKVKLRKINVPITEKYTKPKSYRLNFTALGFIQGLKPYFPSGTTDAEIINTALTFLAQNLHDANQLQFEDPNFHFERSQEYNLSLVQQMAQNFQLADLITGE